MLNLVQYFALTSPALVVFILAVVAMLYAAFGHKSSSLFYFTLFGLALAAFFASQLIGVGDSTTWSLIWNHLFWTDSLSFVLQCFILLAVMISIYYSRQRLADLDSSTGDVLCLYLLSTLGMLLLVSANSLMSLYLALELTSLPLYALVASQRNHLHSIEAAVKFFIMGAIASVFILFGISMLYALTGEMALPVVVKTLASKPVQDQPMLLLGIIFLIAGASFKIALVPFHNWLADVYAGASPVMTLFLSAAPKIAGIGLFLRLGNAGLFELHPLLHHVLALLALISIALGNISALVQTDLRRLLAYSTISHMGYAVLGLIAGAEQGYFATLFYIIVYSLMTIIAFATVLIPNPGQDMLLKVDDLKGMFRRSPWMATMLMIVFFSMAGVPPTIGFMAKFFIIKALVNSGYMIFAIIALILAVIGAFYYLNLIRMMFFEVAAEDKSPIAVNSLRKTAYVIQSLSVLCLGLFPSALIQLCSHIF